jgi:hypothetical protein
MCVLEKGDIESVELGVGGGAAIGEDEVCRCLQSTAGVARFAIGPSLEDNERADVGADLFGPFVRMVSHI